MCVVNYISYLKWVFVVSAIIYKNCYCKAIEVSIVELYKKKLRLQEIIAATDGIVVAFSGGVDSSFLLKVAFDVLKERVLAVTVRSASFPMRELNQAIDFAEKTGITHIQVDFEVLDIKGFSENTVNRCYLCKKELFGKIVNIAKYNGYKYVADGSNMDDLDDYRPGMTASRELGIRSPLREAGLTKDDIRILSKEMDLPTWDKPSFACLVSRIPYGEKITNEKLYMIDQAEQYLMNLGLKQVRVRHHGDIARIEVAADERALFFNEEIMNKVHSEFVKIGFKYVAMDLRGYRTGSMNEVLHEIQ